MDAYKRYEHQLLTEEERIARLDNDVQTKDKKVAEREKKKLARRRKELQRTNEYLRLQVEDKEVRKKIQKHERIGPREFVVRILGSVYFSDTSPYLTHLFSCVHK